MPYFLQSCVHACGALSFMFLCYAFLGKTVLRFARFPPHAPKVSLLPFPYSVTLPGRPSPSIRESLGPRPMFTVLGMPRLFPERPRVKTFSAPTAVRKTDRSAESSGTRGRTDVRAACGQESDGISRAVWPAEDDPVSFGRTFSLAIPEVSVTCAWRSFLLRQRL